MSFLYQRLIDVIQNVLRGGLHDHHDIEINRRVMITNALCCTGIIMLILLGVLSLAQRYFIHFFVIVTLVIILIVSIIYMRVYGNYRTAVKVTVSFVTLFYFYLFVSGGVENTAFVWVYSFPLVTCFAMGSKDGAYTSLLLFLLILAFLSFDTPPAGLVKYSLNFKIRFIASYTVVTAFAFIFEKLREQSQFKLEAKNKELLHTMEHLKIMDARLRKSGEELEQRVKERTIELMLSNQKLIKEQEERSRYEKSLLESEEKYRHLVTYAPAGIYEVDLNLRKFISVNDIMCEMLGYTREEVLSMDPLQLLTEESGNLFLQRIDDVLAGKTVPADVEFVVKARDGRKLWVLLNTRYSYKRGNRLTAMVVVHDITERKKAESERLELERKIFDSQRLESLGILSGGIAHDFNNLLMAILGNLDITLLNLPPASSARLTIERAVQAAHRATDLTRQMLAYSGRGRFLVVPMNLNDLVRENAELFRAAIHRTVVMNLQLSPERTVIKGDPVQIQQVVMNLITNASEAIGEKIGTITLATGVMDCDEPFLSKSLLTTKLPAGKYVYLDVTDNGQGMEEETIQRIFDPFFTTKFIGRGLGMSAVLGIVRGHRGAIIIDSVYGLGTTVQVLFPIHEEQVAELPDPNSSPIKSGNITLFPGTILVVDDEDMVRTVCEKLLQGLGFQTLSASDGEEALSLLKKHLNEITLVLLDLTMPRMSGLQTFQEMKRFQPNLKIILCSGYSEEESKQCIGPLAPDGFIKKPFHLRQLEEKITVALNCSAVASSHKT